MKNGFSLVELSIVLVILGLLVGGVLAGQSLIRAAELRSVSNDFARYQTAIYSFRDKYFGLPGDINNAASIWSGIPNSNADGNISIGGEMHRAWQQLALAGLIEGTYTGLNGGGTGCGSTCNSIAGTNVPRSRISPGGYDFYLLGQDTVADTAVFFSTNTGGFINTMILGAPASNFWHQATLIKPEEAWGIDKKIDDGRAQSGRIFTYRATGCTTTNDPTTADYALSSTGVLCNLLYKF